MRPDHPEILVGLARDLGEQVGGKRPELRDHHDVEDAEPQEEYDADVQADAQSKLAPLLRTARFLTLTGAGRDACAA